MQTVRRFGAISFGVLAQFRSAFWRNFFRRFGAISQYISTTLPITTWHSLPHEHD
jgi:hypothetical protein